MKSQMLPMVIDTLPWDGIDVGRKLRRGLAEPLRRNEVNGMCNDELPKASILDHCHTLTGNVLSSAPLVGGPLGILFNSLIKAPLQRRWEAFFADVLQRICALEAKGILSREDLESDDEFLSTLMQAAQIASRSHESQRLTALRNAVLNTAVGACPEEAKRQMFLHYVDEFSACHLRVLALLGDPDGWIEEEGWPVGENAVLQTGDHIIEAFFPNLASDGYFKKYLLNDLHQRQLTASSGSRMNWTKKGEHEPMLRPLGREFLAFITQAKEQPQSR